MKPVIAIVFDFDDTLAPDSTSGFLASLGIDTDWFWTESVRELLNAGWDPIPAYLYRMLEWSAAQAPADRITRAKLAAWGPQVKLAPGATEIFAQLRDHVRQLNPHAELEFYLISSGIREILRHTPVAGEFRDIWGCDFATDDTGAITFPRNVVSFTDKTRFLFQISKGQVGPEYRNRPGAVNDKIAWEDIRVPFKQMIVVGDGYTDIPCFALVQHHGGVAIGVFDPEDRQGWAKAWGFVRDRRVTNLVPADYRPGSALHSTLLMATAGIVQCLE